jgi:hypothetical protein
MMCSKWFHNCQIEQIEVKQEKKESTLKMISHESITDCSHHWPGVPLNAREHADVTPAQQLEQFVAKPGTTAKAIKNRIWIIVKWS